MEDVERLRKIKMDYLEKIEKMEMEEIKRLRKIKLEELNRLEKIKLEEIEHLDEIKLSEIERLKKLKFEENERFSDMKILKYFDIEMKNLYIQLVLGELEIFGEKEMENLEQIIKDEIERLEKIKNDIIEKHKNLLMNEIERHKNLEKEEIERLKKIEQEELNHFKIVKKEYVIERNPKIDEMQFDIYEFLTFVKYGRLMGAPPSKKQNKYLNTTNIKIIFEENNLEFNNEINEPIVIECSLTDKIALLIEKYKEKMGNNTHTVLFFYENKELSPDLTLEEENLYDGCKIKVING